MILGIHLVIGVTVLVAVGLTTTYSLSVAAGHVNPLWCYISYTGNYSVESCIFSLVFNLSAAVYVFIVFLRYVQLSAVISVSDLPEKKHKRLDAFNLLSAVLGALGAFGLSVAGCFQQRVFHLLHVAGVFLCTCLTVVYAALQTHFTYVLPRLETTAAIKALRLIVVVVSCCVVAAGFLLAVCHSSGRRFEFEVFSSAATPKDVASKVGVAFEWILFILNQIFICSFCPDFKKIALRKDRIVLL